MRNFINLSIDKQAELTEQFPDLLKLVCVEETHKYSYLAVSVFDRWLGQEDSVKLLNDVPKSEQVRRNNLLYLFTMKLAQNTEVVNFKLKGKWKNSYPCFRGFTSAEAKAKYFEPAISYISKDFFRVVLPELNAVYFESWDDTNVLYLRDPSKVQLINKWATECGVFCLEK